MRSSLIPGLDFIYLVTQVSFSQEVAPERTVLASSGCQSIVVSTAGSPAHSGGQRWTSASLPNLQTQGFFLPLASRPG